MGVILLEMNNDVWSLIAALVSAAAAVVAALVAIITLRNTAQLAAMTALEQRFSAINHVKIANPQLWESLHSSSVITGAAAHLVFETFQFYHQAFFLRQEGTMTQEQFDQWERRLLTDIRRFKAYRQWWSTEQPEYHACWNEQFIKRVEAAMEEIQQADGAVAGSSRSHFQGPPEFIGRVIGE